MLRGIQHCAVVVDDLAAARRFYGDALGMDEVPRPESFTFEGAWYRAGDDEIHLIAAKETTCPPGLPDPGRGVQTGMATHFAFEVDSVDAMVARLAEHDVVPTAGPMARGDGVLQVYVHDPDGYLVELFQVTGADQSGAPERAPVR